MHELQALLAQHGLLLVFGNVLLAQLGLPLPAMPILIIAGALVAQGDMGLASILAVTLVASLLGDTPWYFAGRRYGYRVLRLLCRIAIEPDTCVKQTEILFERWGAPSLIFAKYIPGFATVAPPLAGAMQLPFSRFAAYSALGALLWAIAPLLAGALLSAQVEQALAWMERTGSRGPLVVAAIIAAYILLKLVERHLMIRYLRSTRISVSELLAMLNAGAPLVLLDVRSDIARRLDPRHIPGAIAINLAQVENVLDEAEINHDIVVYCS